MNETPADYPMIDFSSGADDAECRPPRHARDRSLHWIAMPGQEPVLAEWVSGFWVRLGCLDWDSPLILSAERWRYIGEASPAPLQ
jgi:hypothetical protein